MVLEQGLADRITKDIREFIDNPKWYIDRGEKQLGLDHAVFDAMVEQQEVARWGWTYSASPIPRNEGEKKVVFGDDFF